MTKERYYRRSGKWAKITKRSDGVYTVALGWKDNPKASKVMTTGKMFGLAYTIAENWLDD